MVSVQDSDIGRFWSHLFPQTHQAYSYYGIISLERNPKTNWATAINSQTRKTLHLSAFNQKAPSCLVKDAYLFFLKLWPKEQSSNKLKQSRWQLSSSTESSIMITAIIPTGTTITTAFSKSPGISCAHIWCLVFIAAILWTLFDCLALWPVGLTVLIDCNKWRKNS